MEPWRAVGAHNRGVEAQNGAMKGRGRSQQRCGVSKLSRGRFVDQCPQIRITLMRGRVRIRIRMTLKSGIRIRIRLKVKRRVRIHIIVFRIGNNYHNKNLNRTIFFYLLYFSTTNTVYRYNNLESME
jgi:hypothetical protein